MVYLFDVDILITKHLGEFKSKLKSSRYQKDCTQIVMPQKNPIFEKFQIIVNIFWSGKKKQKKKV
jgi:hypothetical protein